MTKGYNVSVRRQRVSQTVSRRAPRKHTVPKLARKRVRMVERTSEKTVRKVTRVRRNPASRFTRKANTPKRSRQWQHVYDSAITQGFSRGDAILIANGVIKKTMLKRNPTRKGQSRLERQTARRYLITAAVIGQRFVMYFAHDRFTDNLYDATRYYSLASAKAAAKRILDKLPGKVKWLKVVKG